MTLHVVVIGAGIVGATTALALLRDGHRVTIVEPGEPGEPGGEQAASYGNGAWLSPASVVPMSMPGMWKKVPTYLADPLGPLTIRVSALPQLLPWLVRFLAAGATVPRVEATTRALAPLLRTAPAQHARLAAEAGVPEMIRQDGLLYAYPDRRAFEAEALAWRLRRDNGVGWIELSADQLRTREPALDPRYQLGILVEAGAHCIDPGGYVAAHVRHAVALRASLVKAHAAGFDVDSNRLRAVTTDVGSIACDRAVIAAGIRAKPLAFAAGDRVSLASERGYHVVIADPEAAPRAPIMPSDGKMANTMTSSGLRASGQVELAAIDAPPNWKRAQVLLEHLRRAYPGLAKDIPQARLSRWMGHRPSTPDGRPVIGPASACHDIVHAFGHGHVGLAAAPATASLVADLIGGRQPDISIESYSAKRFR